MNRLHTTFERYSCCYIFHKYITFILVAVLSANAKSHFMFQPVRKLLLNPNIQLSYQRFGFTILLLWKKVWAIILHFNVAPFCNIYYWIWNVRLLNWYLWEIKGNLIFFFIKNMRLSLYAIVCSHWQKWLNMSFAKDQPRSRIDYTIEIQDHVIVVWDMAG